MLRSAPAEFGYELNEFDPFFNYRATSFIVENGYFEYLDWHDDKSWYPNGRDVSNSQSMLHLTAATTYQIFGGSTDLYDFTIIFPVVFGSLTAIVVFALVRVIGGTSAGLLAALFYSVSVPILVRGTIGWFKSEPLGLFYGVLGIYLFASGIKSDNKKIAALKLAGAGIFLSFGLSSWGGIQFFILPLGVFFLVLPFLRNDHRFQMWAIPLFTASFAAAILLFDRPGPSFLTGLGGLAIIGPTISLVICNVIMMYSKKEKTFRNGILFLGGILASGVAIISASFAGAFLGIPSFRYLNAVNPFLTTTHPLVDSVSEHATTTLAQSFYFHSILMVFAGIAIWLILQNKTSTASKNYDMYGFALIIGIAGVYVSSAFVRLEIFASLSLLILGSIGISKLFSKLFEAKSFGPKSLSKLPLMQVLFSVGIIVILIIPLNVPANGNWTNAVAIPPTILNGGTVYPIVSNDWPDALSWIATQTPEDSVVAAWWDYGYWITVVGNRTSIVDNATIDDKAIAKMATVFVSSPDEAWKMLGDMGADYILVFVAAEKIFEDETITLYTLQGGGDESKKQWFIRIAGQDVSKYLHADNISGTPYFWDNTSLGKLFPYTPVVYFDPVNNFQYETYNPGTIPLYVKQVKYSPTESAPFHLVYASPSYLNNDERFSLGIFIYQINENYVPVQ